MRTPLLFIGVGILGVTGCGGDESPATAGLNPPVTAGQSGSGTGGNGLGGSGTGGAATGTGGESGAVGGVGGSGGAETGGSGTGGSGTGGSGTGGSGTGGSGTGGSGTGGSGTGGSGTGGSGTGGSGTGGSGTGGSGTGGSGTGGSGTGGSGTGGSGTGGSGTGGSGAGGSGAGGSGAGGSGAGGSGTGGTGGGGTGGSGGGGCGTIPSGAKDVYVDKNSVKASVGTDACPFHTIAEATKLTVPGGGLVIHVRGTSATNYSEAAPVVLLPGMALIGDGIGKVTISAGGNCAPSVNCAVAVSSGASLDNVTVRGVGGAGVNGIATIPNLGSTAPALVKTVRTTLNAGDGLRALVPTTLGPNFDSVSNSGSGAVASATLTVLNGSNAFDSNGEYGISMQMASSSSGLTLSGATAANNRLHGVLLNQGTHNISRLIAIENGDATSKKHSGVHSVGATLKLRTSTLLKNSGNGLTVAGGAVDVGNKSSGGCNTFSAGNASTNGLSGLCVALPSVLPADGNNWSSCSPNPDTLQSKVPPGNDCYAPRSYTDLSYTNAKVSVQVCGSICL